MTKAPPLTSWHAQRHADDGVRVFSREWRAKGDGQSPSTSEQAPAFVPLCFDADELARWEGWSSRQDRVLPCHDCLVPFAEQMRAAGRCNGSPGGVERDEDQPALPARKEISQCRAIGMPTSPTPDAGWISPTSRASPSSARREAGRA